MSTIDKEQPIDSDSLLPTDGVISLPHGGLIKTFPQPPGDFDPLQASAGDLQAYGIPTRPTDADLLRLWAQAQRCARVEPVLQRLEAGAQAPQSLAGSSSTVAGVVGPRGGGKVQFVTGAWTVPNVYPPRGAADGVWYSASSQIATSRNDSALKFGVQCRVQVSLGMVLRQVVPFWELPRYGLFQVVSLTVAPGDVVVAAIEVDSATNAARLSMSNITAGAGVAFTVFGVAGETLPDLSCGWLVEALKINSPDVALAQFGRVHFEGAYGQSGPYRVEPGSCERYSLYQAGRELAWAGTPEATRVTVVYGKNPF